MTSDDDIIIVNRNQSSFKLKILDSIFIEDDDILIVQRGGASFHLTGKEFLAGTFEDDDLFIVNRNGQSYKATGEYMKEILNLNDDGTIPDEPPPFPPEVVPPDPGIVVGNWTMSLSADIPNVGRGAANHTACMHPDVNPFGQWISLTFTYDAATRRSTHYYNGKFVSSKIIDHSPTNEYNGSNLALFTLDPNNGSYKAAMKQWFRTFRQYDRVLTDEEVRNTYVLDQDFTKPYRPSGVEGKIVELDARESRREIDTNKNHCYIENLVTGSMRDFWWTDGRKGNINTNGATNPNLYMEFDDTYGIYKLNDGRGDSNGGWISSNYHPYIDVDFTFQYTIAPLSMGRNPWTWLMAIAVVGWTNIELSIGTKACAPIVYPPVTDG